VERKKGGGLTVSPIGAGNRRFLGGTGRDEALTLALTLTREKTTILYAPSGLSALGLGVKRPDFRGMSLRA
jgi:hypothetical protein